MRRILPYLVVTAVAPPQALATEITCTPVQNGFPRDKTYGGTRNMGAFSNQPDKHYGIRIRTTSPATYCTPTSCTIEQISIETPNWSVGPLTYRGDIAQGVWLAQNPMPPVTVSPTPTVKYKITPADGSTLYGTSTDAATSATLLLVDTVTNRITYTSPTPISQSDADPIARATTSYRAPDQHDFGDVAPSSSGAPLVLPAPSSGLLRAKINWDGPAGTTMTRKIGSGSAYNVTQGTTYQFGADGQGLQLDLHASDTASPGAITGNLTLTLTCP